MITRPHYVQMDGIFSKTIGWIVGKGNRPGDKYSRTGQPNDEQLEEMVKQQLLTPPPSAFGMQPQQIMVLGMGALALYFLTRKR